MVGTLGSYLEPLIYNKKYEMTQIKVYKRNQEKNLNKKRKNLKRRDSQTTRKKI